MPKGADARAPICTGPAEVCAGSVCDRVCYRRSCLNSTVREDGVEPDPDIEELVRQIEEAHEEHLARMREGPAPDLAMIPTDQPHCHLDDEALERAIDRELKSAAWAAMEFLGRHKQAGGAVEQAPLTLDDLNVCLRKLSGAKQKLQPLVDEMLLRRPSKKDAAGDDHLGMFG